MAGKWVECSTQSKFDAALTAGDVPCVSSGGWAASGSATVRAFDSATVRAYDSATVQASGSATVSAYGSATVRAYGSATVRAYGSATVRAFDSATVRAFDSATVRASGSATVWAYDSATVRAFDSATVRAYDSATVQAYDSATVQASGSATVSAYDSATVSATPLVPVHDHGPNVRISGGIPIPVRPITDPKQWCEFHGLDVDRGKVTVFKAVEADWRGGRKADGITYAPGDKPEAPDWRKDREEYRREAVADARQEEE